MSRENALPPDDVDIVPSNVTSTGTARLLIQQLERQEAGVPFIHMKTLQLSIAECAQHSDTADAEHHFLGEAIAQIAKTAAFPDPFPPTKVVISSSRLTLVPFGPKQRKFLMKIGSSFIEDHQQQPSSVIRETRKQSAGTFDG